MTKSQCYNEIARNKQLISQYQNEINKLNKEINELNATKKKLSTLKDTLADCKSKSINRLSNTNSVMKINSKIVNKFYSNMNELIAGSEYFGIYNGLSNGLSRVLEEIATKKNQISRLQRKIENCYSEISNLNNTIKNIEIREAEEARRKAEEGKP